MTDLELLQAFAADRSEDAIAALIDRYVRLVYSACVRQLGDRHLAEDATQGVFVVLSQRAGKVPGERLASWLITTSRYACANIRKREMRREQREQVIAMQQDQESQQKDVELLAMLDEGLCHLAVTDREAVVLRYLEEWPLLEVGRAMGISEEAARKRVARGVEKLRGYFARRGVSRDSIALSAVLADQGRGAAMSSEIQRVIKEGILRTCRGGASGGAGVTIASEIGRAMLITKLRAGGLAAAIAVVLCGGGWLLSQALADKPGMPQAAGAQVSAAPASGPVLPEVVIDLSTPEKTIDSLCRALEAGNRAEFYACLTTDPNRSPTSADATFELALAQNRLIHAAKLVFGNSKVTGLDAGDGLFHAMMAGWPAGVEVAKFDGDRATLPIVIPAELLRTLPEQSQANAQMWLGKSIPFVRIDNQWRIDMDHFMRAEARLAGPGNHVADSAATTTAVIGEAKILGRIAEDISAGKFDSWDDAHDELKEKYMDMLGKAGGFTSLHTTMMPVEQAK